MWRDWGPGSRVLPLLLLMQLPLPGNGNEGSISGSCYCDDLLSDLSPAKKAHIRKYVRDYQRCPAYVRFRLHSRTVCGGNVQQWVREVMSCLDNKECGLALLASQAHQKQPPSLSTQAPEPTEGAPSHLVTPAQTHLPSTQQPTLPVAAQSLDRGLIYSNESTTFTVSHNLGAGLVAGENQKQLEGIGSLAAGTSALVPVLSLLLITFILTGVLLYVLCNRKRQQARKYCPDLQLHYRPVAADSIA
ncbi:C-X-C motif chemokine 16 [Echinops telfairi]|uniref:C-X-C motif chemokine 16 n=2 Tax=Echinops telfairi TaxID=9371 RepID=A0AC55DCH0_ECHTE|nr:C-X-C motif chemokine 16 [Echinops telfairi]XP_045149443.1 C-X-C motif chemokine 16 [Echinops telfairi]